MFLILLPVLFIFFMLVIFLIVFMRKILINEGWRQGLVVIAYFIISDFITPIILHPFDIKDKGIKIAI
jgi:hypothetical protein